MNLDDFTCAMAGELVPIPEGGYAFVPAPVPPRVEIGLQTIELLALAERALGELEGLGRMLPNPHLLSGPFLRQEAVMSSRDGTPRSWRSSSRSVK